MSDKAFQLGDNDLAAYIFNHYNWKFDFLRLTVQEIVDEYLKVHVRGGNTGPDFQHQCPQDGHNQKSRTVSATNCNL